MKCELADRALSLDLLKPAAREALERHAAGCEACSASLADMRLARAGVRAHVVDVRPSARVAVWSGVERAVERSPWWAPVLRSRLAAASVGFAFVVLVAIFAAREPSPSEVLASRVAAGELPAGVLVAPWLTVVAVPGGAVTASSGTRFSVAEHDLELTELVLEQGELSVDVAGADATLAVVTGDARVTLVAGRAVISKVAGATTVAVAEGTATVWGRRRALPATLSAGARVTLESALGASAVREPGGPQASSEPADARGDTHASTELAGAADARTAESPVAGSALAHRGTRAGSADAHAGTRAGSKLAGSADARTAERAVAGSAHGGTRARTELAGAEPSAHGGTEVAGSAHRGTRARSELAGAEPSAHGGSEVAASAHGGTRARTELAGAEPSAHGGTEVAGSAHGGTRARTELAGAEPSAHGGSEVAASAHGGTRARTELAGAEPSAHGGSEGAGSAHGGTRASSELAGSAVAGSAPGSRAGSEAGSAAETLREARAALRVDAPRAAALAERVLERAPASAVEADALAVLADAERRRGRLGAAAELYGRLAAHADGTSYAEEALLQRAMILARIATPEAALRELARAAERFPNGPTAPERAALAAQIHLSANEPARAADAIERVVTPGRSLELLQRRVDVARALLRTQPFRARALIQPVLTANDTPPALRAEAEALFEKTK